MRRVKTLPTRPLFAPTARERRQVEDRLWLPVVEAALCLELKCSAVFRISERVCPACSSTSIVPLTKWLNRSA